MGFSWKSLFLGFSHFIMATSLHASLSPDNLRKLADSNSAQLCRKSIFSKVSGAYSYKLNDDCTGVVVRHLNDPLLTSQKFILGKGLLLPEVIGEIVYIVGRDSQQLWLMFEGKCQKIIQLSDIPYRVSLDREHRIHIAYLSAPETVISTADLQPQPFKGYKEHREGELKRRVYNNAPDLEYIITTSHDLLRSEISCESVKH